LQILVNSFSTLFAEMLSMPSPHDKKILPLLLCVGLFSSAEMTYGSPVIKKLSVRGLQAGATTPIVIEGSELMPEAGLLMPVAGVTIQVKPTSTPERVEADVTVDAATPPGIYLLRSTSAKGVSNSIPVGIDTLPQTAFVPEISALPVAFTGDLAGSTIVATAFAGKKGQRVVIDVECRRLGSNFRPVVELIDARRVQVAWSKPLGAIGGDARCEAVLPADGRYTIELHDLVYGAEPGAFRMKIGDLQYADLVFPLGVEKGKPAALEYLSTSFPAGTTAAADTANVGTHPAPWPSSPGIIGTRPRLSVSDHAEVTEQPIADANPQVLPTAPVAVSGKLLARGEHDRYRLPVTAGQKLRLELYSDRLGAPVDGVLAVLNEQGGQLATSDDQLGTKDPGLDFAVPEGVAAVLLDVRDVRGFGGPNNAYRLDVTRTDTPDFSLFITEDLRQIPAGGVSMLPVHAIRRGYDGPIKVTVQGLAGVIAAEGEIPAGVNGMLLNLTAPPSGATHSLITVVGESTDPQVPLKRIATIPETPILKLYPWARDHSAIGIAPVAPLTLAWDLPGGDSGLVIGKSVPAHVKIERPAGTTGAVRLSLVSSQPPPPLRILENNQPKSVDDLDRVLRFEGEPTIAADQTEITTNLIVPFDLKPRSYDVTVRADLLAADNKTVIGSVFAPVRRLQMNQQTPEQPLAIFEDQPEFIEKLTQGAGQALIDDKQKYSGKVSLQIKNSQKSNEVIPDFAIKIRQNPAPGEFRYLQFAWKKPQGNIALSLSVDGKFRTSKDKIGYRYQAGGGALYNGIAIRVDAIQPQEFTVITRDLYADFGEFTITGLGFAAVEGPDAWFDHVYLGRTPADFELAKP
jgi:hypothetical protein